MSIAVPSWPSEIQCSSSTSRSSSGAVSSRSASATTRRPARRAPAAARNGKRPLPAIRPSGCSSQARYSSASSSSSGARRRSSTTPRSSARTKATSVRTSSVSGPLRLDAAKRLGERQLRRLQQPAGLLERGDRARPRSRAAAARPGSAPKKRARFPTVSENGSTSLVATVAPPTNACVAHAAELVDAREAADASRSPAPRRGPRAPRRSRGSCGCPRGSRAPRAPGP